MAKLKPYEEYKGTSILWNEETPKHWDIIRGKELFVNRKDVNKNYQCNNILSLTLRGVVNNDLENPIGLVPKDYSTYQIFEQDDLVFKLIDLENQKTSRVGLVHEKGIMSSAYIRLKNKEECNIKYFYYQYYDLYLKGVYNKLGDGVRSTLNAKDLLNIRVVQPPREEQDQIAKFLDNRLSKINRFIKAKKKQIELLKEQKQAIINQAVTKGINPNVPMKDSGVEWIGEIPEHWEVKPLKYYVKSNTETLTENHDKDSIIHYIDISTVGFGFLKQEPVRYFFKDAPSRARRVIRKGDTIISTVRTYLKSMCYIDEKLDGYIASTGFSVLTPKEIVYPQLLNFILSTDYFVNAVNKHSIGVSYPAITDWKLLNIKIALPVDIEEQALILKSIKSKTKTIDKAIGAIQKQIDLVEEYRISLISEVVTGKVDVRHIVVEDTEDIEGV